MPDDDGQRTGPSAPTRPRAAALVSCAAGLVAFLAYAATAARTITWWDGSSYPLAACTLGINGSPGSLLLVLIGWLASRVPLVRPVAFQLNLLAGLLAAATVALVTWLAIRLATPEDRTPGSREIAGGAIAGLTLAFGATLWGYAVQFTPYVLTALFTAAILVVAVEWWRRADESDRPGGLFLLFLLFGLDVSVHRTNLLLLPAALAWVTLRRPGAVRRLPAWGAALGGLALGLAFHLLLIPLARRDPLFNIDDPSTLERFWDYVTIERVGGGFLIHLFPRTADFVRVQLADYWAFLGRNLWPASGGALRLLPLLLALAGWAAALARSPRRSLGLLAFFLCASLGAVVYFNLPAHYFRSMDRHYLPSLVVVAPLVGVGVTTLLGLAARARGGVGAGSTLALAGLLLLAPLGQWLANREACDLSRVRFAETYSRDVLEPLPPGAILLTNGDNDTFPLWYLQQVEGVRRDVIVINVPCLNTRWYVAQLRRHHAFLSDLPVRLRSASSPDSLAADSTETLPVDARGDLGLPPGTTVPASLVFRLPSEPYPQDHAVLALMRVNRWRRPIHLACTVTRDNLPWIWPFARLDGMTYRIVPSDDPAVVDMERPRQVMLHAVRYAGVADSTVRMDNDTRMLCRNYMAALLQVAYAQMGRGDPRGALATLDVIEERVPPGRLGMEEDPLTPLRAQAKSLIEAADAAR